ncbi:hypothetical protein DAPK24_046350 [Pichia kluyveri]|uniref:Uncharacterized protein n=1 Tax=Pichia kluyveri TaxID=36015 RepID=A0AAV5RAL3_PICKL|nr:hypothetical protein DAPK24_046350 [Pichia kluyveri]
MKRKQEEVEDSSEEENNEVSETEEDNEEEGNNGIEDKILDVLIGKDEDSSSESDGENSEGEIVNKFYEEYDDATVERAREAEVQRLKNIKEIEENRDKEGDKGDDDNNVKEAINSIINIMDEDREGETVGSAIQRIQRQLLQEKKRLKIPRSKLRQPLNGSPLQDKVDLASNALMVLMNSDSDSNNDVTNLTINELRNML